MADLLLVDDDPRIAELCAWFLERRGHRVRRVTSYAAARGAIAECSPELMLADLELGLESGREELPRMAAEGILPPTLVVSGYLGAALAQELGALEGVVGMLPKPFDVDELVARVDRVLALAVSSPVRASDPVPVEQDDGWIEIVPRAERGAGQ